MSQHLFIMMCTIKIMGCLLSIGILSSLVYNIPLVKNWFENITK